MTDKAPAGRLCIFDLDGTLAETAPDLVNALNHVLRTEELPEASFAEARAYVGHGARVLIERAHAAHDITLDDAAAVALTERFVDYYGENIAHESALFPGVLDAMDMMAEEGWRFAICTNKREGLAVNLLQTLGVADRFDAICGGDTFDFRKPDGRHITATAQAAGGPEGRILMIGDSAPDILAAKDAGVPSVAVTFGYAQDDVSSLGADAVIEHFTALPALAETLVTANGA
ncbi:MAG: phosphoglycolate phosphatase [Devosiaceae bacterium]|nr:phosphoglycolate phosphatase [Devosiaceae bacterium MH13]